VTDSSEHRPRRRFSQNFLVDKAVVADIVRAISPQRRDRVVEIGPGLGALTAALLEKVDSMEAIEIDRDAVRVLTRQFGERLTVHAGDALKFDFAGLGDDLRIVGNLPYHISTPLLFCFDAIHGQIRDCHFMLQKEVVQRMAADPDTEDYGRLSVMLQYRWLIEPLFDVPPDAFRPQPKVWSSIVRMSPRPGTPLRAVDELLFSRIVAAAFSQRRKTLRNALRSIATDADFVESGIDAGARGETLSVPDFVRLADCVASRAEPAGKP
jgi:16S rRNA (adenine1518-N6/adenine1519-N6)-dimethyltransferase